MISKIMRGSPLLRKAVEKMDKKRKKQRKIVSIHKVTQLSSRIFAVQFAFTI